MLSLFNDDHLCFSQVNKSITYMNLLDLTRHLNKSERSPLTHSSFPQPREAAASLLSAQEMKLPTLRCIRKQIHTYPLFFIRRIFPRHSGRSINLLSPSIHEKSSTSPYRKRLICHHYSRNFIANIKENTMSYLQTITYTTIITVEGPSSSIPMPRFKHMGLFTTVTKLDKDGEVHPCKTRAGIKFWEDPLFRHFVICHMSFVFSKQRY
jgi:hypothetical protein